MEEFSPPPISVEPTPRWIRVKAGDEWVADSRRAQLLSWYGPGMLPTYCIPDADVQTGMLTPSPVGSGGFLVDHDLRAGDRVIERAAQRFQAPPGDLAALEGHWTFPWDGRLRWFEEAEEVEVHARVPTHRVDAVPSERHVRVEVDGHLLAETNRPHALFETTLPTRWYIPVHDVFWELLEPSDTVSRCPYKGTARYWTLRSPDGAVQPDIAWSYPNPIPECPRIAGLVSFFNELVDLTIDGELQHRPRTPWS